MMQKERSRQPRQESNKLVGGSALLLAIGLALYNVGDDTVSAQKADGNTITYDLTDASVLSRSPTQQEQLIEEELRRTDIVTGAQVRVDCLPDDLMVDLDEGIQVGFVNPESIGATVAVMHIRQSVCVSFVQYAEDPGTAWLGSEHALALIAVAHEGNHIRTGMDWRHEAVVNCYAYQEMFELAVALGADATAMEHLNEAARYTYAHQPSEYQTRDCYDGGPYDMYPAGIGYFPFASPE